jgi:hypothetical protein
MARAPVSKTDYFSFKISVHSEKIAKFNPLSINTLAADSEYDPLASGRRYRWSVRRRLQAVTHPIAASH